VTLPPVALVLLGGWAIVAVFMVALWAWQRTHRDGGIADVGWSASLGLLALFDAALLPGPPARRLLVATLAAIWSFRLAWHLLTDRVLGKPEDGRYQALRRQWDPHPQPMFFAFFQLQAFAAALLALPFAVAMAHPRPLGWPDALAVIVWSGALAGEANADTQLARWRGNPANRGRTCREGLWAWSRHPNYFFEWLYWWTWVLFAWGSPLGAWVLLAPAVMLLLLFRLTGIPGTEARALETRGDDYRDYQRTTSMFVPLPPRRTR
jgi:steroid 5-alpha reductase family enzyme